MSQPPASAADNSPASPRPSPRPTALGRELGGSLPCARCRYDLKGLSVVAVCPECGTPVRATLLSVVDPNASELRPLHRPKWTAWGMVLWGVAGLLCALSVWGARLLELAGQASLAAMTPDGLAVVAVFMAVLSGVGATAMLDPHDGLSTRDRRLAVVGVALYLPLVALLYRTLVTYDFAHSAPYAFGQVTDPQRVMLRIATTLTLALMLWCLRGNARALAARSYLMRTGRVDRQTMAAMLGVLGIVLAGDVVLLVGASLAGPTEEQLRQVGRLIVLVGNTLFTLGLAGIALDCLRLRPVLEEPPLTLDRVLRGSDATSG